MTDSFGLIDKMNDAEGRCLSCGAPLPAGRESQQKFTGGKMSVQVIGQNNKELDDLVSNVKKALVNTGRNLDVQVITDEKIIDGFHLRKQPALIINGSIVSQGIISSVEEIEAELDYIY
ncbi:MAG: thioredoxin family protein [Lachnospiraceae bacterium]|nr:thioredoxin family protein [Lachnospiraceae bacterium]